MSRSLQSFPEEERHQVAMNRISTVKGVKDGNALKGLGYWGAEDYFSKVKGTKVKEMKENG